MSRIDLSSRISARAVASGIPIGLVLFGLLVLPAGAFGLWSPALLARAEARGLGPGLLVWASVAWLVSAYVSGWVTAVISRSTERRDGLLHGLVVWAGACLAGSLLACTWFMAAVATKIAPPDLFEPILGRGALLALTVVHGLGLAASLLGGSNGARAEARAEHPAVPAAAGGDERPLVPRPPAPQPV